MSMPAEQENREAASAVHEDGVVRVEKHEGGEVMIEEVAPVFSPIPEDSVREEPESGRASDPNWQRIQASFIDDPRASVVQAAALAEKAADALLAGNDTEKLRITLRAYRTFYEEISQI